MQRRGALLTAGGVAVLLTGVAVTVAVASGGAEAPAETSGRHLVIESTTSAPASSSTITPTTTVVLPTAVVLPTPAAPVDQSAQQVQPAQRRSGDTGDVTEPQPTAPAAVPAAEPVDTGNEITAPAPPPQNCWMDYSDPERPHGVEVCEPA